MSQYLSYTDWLFESTITEEVSQLAEFYSRAGGSNMPARAPKKTREEEMALAKQSSLKRTNLGNWTIKPTLHGSAQAQDRVPDITSDQWMAMHGRMVDTLKKITDIPQKRETEVIFYSKSLNQGYVVAHDPQNKELRIMTVLPRGNPFAKSGTKKIVMESKVDLFYADMDAICEGEEGAILENMTFDWDAFYNTVKVDADALGLVYDYETVNKIVVAHQDVLDLDRTVTLKVPLIASTSPDKPQRLGYLNYEITRVN